MGDPVIHKGNYKNTKTVYLGFRQYGELPTAMCDKHRGYGRMKQWHYCRNWKNVTCKKCLRTKEKENEQRN